MNRELQQVVVDLVRVEAGLDLGEARASSVGGGCINEAYRLTSTSDESARVFVKVNRASSLPMFEAEFAGLQEIAESGTIRVPEPIGLGTVGGNAYLCLSYVDLSSRGDVEAQRSMGIQLAAMHRKLSPDGQFGWHRDNTIGETRQINDYSESWEDFFRDHRLRYQFELAEKKGHRFSRAQELLDHIPGLLQEHDPEPSLLHGDLWGGNAGYDDKGEPVLYDPAVYFGDRETDLAFTELFGGFGPVFYEGYSSAWPLEEGYEKRKTLYNLYHILNHYNLFGGGYALQAEGMIDRLL